MSRVIPLTPPGPLWSQREYVECMKHNVGFAAHRYGELGQAFHYAFDDKTPCTTIIVKYGDLQSYIDHPFNRSIDWIERCSAAIRSNA